MTATQSYVNMNSCTTVLSADQQQKEETMLDQQKITILYCRLSNEDALDGESNSIANHDVMYRGWNTPKNITS
ncbi:hypothetical protein [Anaerotignum sp.]|uniref:hypothetical protein n=1 Tax=Anaerotignum sp. TaxID=2039241 RepID=UPI003A83B2C6